MNIIQRIILAAISFVFVFAKLQINSHINENNTPKSDKTNLGAYLSLKPKFCIKRIGTILPHVDLRKTNVDLRKSNVDLRKSNVEIKLGNVE